MLSALILVPLLTALVVGFLPTNLMAKGARNVTLIVTSGLFIWSLVLLAQFNPSQMSLQFQEQLSWIESIGLTYSLGIDGLSMPLLVLNGLLTAMAVYCSDEELERPRFY
ncbi:MAG: NAD(P)H-quinone oxidoreductase subunit D4, partial [Coleofasciculus sp. C2-GNP5-27]